MPARKTAAKSLRQNAKHRERNRAVRSDLRTQVKKCVKATEAGNADAAREELRLTVKALDKSAASGLIKKNTAARRKSRLTKKVNKLASAG